ncbi:MAG: PD-(D/E)XK nuclease family protein, partial [Defluviitaleaceae bacterium]|nr:PD-(D/E)XK nuclease family protein [Defluviitaleaceae bacterium]
EKKNFRACRFGDIAILSRSISNIANDVVHELKKHGIDAIADKNENFFELREIKIATAFLRVTDNPRQDIELITVLSSPVYNFDADELFEISRCEGDDFFERLMRRVNFEEMFEKNELHHENKHCENIFRANEFEKKICASDSQLHEKNLSKKTDACDSRLHEKNLTKKIRAFLSDLEKWRAAAVYMPISRLIGFIFDSTRLPAQFARLPDGENSRALANLQLLFERAIEFEETSLKGLFHFIRYVERLGAAGNVASASQPGAAENKVRLMSIHKSKGLEFPVVICAFLAKKFNTDDERRPVIFHSREGVGAYFVDTVLRTRANTLSRFGLQKLTQRENISEELRCLYVAMTRAKEHLVLTGNAKNYEKSLEKWNDFQKNFDEGETTTDDTSEPLPAFYRRNVANYLDWLMPCVFRRPAEAEKLFEIRRQQVVSAPKILSREHARDENFLVDSNERTAEFSSERSENFSHDFSKKNDAQRDENFLQKSDAQRNENFSQKNSAQEKIPPTEPKNLHEILLVGQKNPLPSKLSISEIRRLYDITPDSTLANETFSGVAYAPIFEPPTFFAEREISSRGVDSRENAAAAAKIGSALHKITEHINFEIHTTTEKIEEFIFFLVQKNFIAPDEAAVIDREKIKTLTNSPLATRIKNAAAASKLFRETPFVLALSATELFADADDEKILVHGIIDCHFEENGKIVLIDFKSDNIPRTVSTDEWAKKHYVQLKIYKQALEKAAKKEVAEVLLYSFARGETVTIQ